jgi:alpha-N-acetylglucosamine transferase
MASGYLYVANKPKFIKEAIVSAKSVRQFSNLPIALIATQDLVNDIVLSYFDQIVIVEDLNSYTYIAKIVGLLNSPFDQTIFLDSDTFVCSNIDELFGLLDLVDIATTQEAKKHTYVFPEMKYKNIFPEFNSGVILFQKNEKILKLFNDWLAISINLHIQEDMPGLREAILKNFDTIKFSILPEEYNSHGYKSMLMLHGEVKVIHERLGSNWKTLTPFFMTFDKMNAFAKKINRIHYKRIYVPYIGLVPFNYSPANFILKFKKSIGIKRISKNR